MGKRRTKNQKTKLRKHAELSSLYVSTQDAVESVKGEFHFEPTRIKAESKKSKNAKVSPKQDTAKPLKREIVKSLVLASLILSLEMVLYFAWK